MAAESGQPNYRKGCGMIKKSFDTSSQVTKKKAMDISSEPEMIELKRMIRAGELDPRRTVENIKGDLSMETKQGEGKKEIKLLTIRMPEEMHRALKVKAAKEGQTVSVIVLGLIREYLTSADK